MNDALSVVGVPVGVIRQSRDSGAARRNGKASNRRLDPWWAILGLNQ